MWLLIAACAAPRLLALAVFRDPQPTLYQAVADNLAAGRGYVVEGGSAAYLEPLYPALLAAGRLLGDTTGMFAVQLAAACAGGVLLFAVARTRAGERGAWIVSLLYAGSPYLARQAAAFMEVTVATALAIAAVWSVDRARTPARALVAGLILAALLLTRLSFLPIAIGALVVLAVTRGARLAAAAAAVVAVTMTAWLLFNRAVSGDYLPQRAGENLFVTTSEWSAGIVPRYNVDLLLPPAHELAFARLGADATTGECDRFLLREALLYARAHPGRTAALKLRNLAAVLQPRLVPFTELRGRAVVTNGAVTIPPQGSRPLLYEIAAGGFQAVLLAGAAAGLWKRRYHLVTGDAMLLLVALSVVAVNVVFFPTSRLLAPMSFVLMFYTGASLGR